ncbi:MAG TPA: hypothetical protein VK957_18655 [Lunatimonas sp.]|nr:hypothetical protein [Lunatimonas sp.]
MLRVVLFGALLICFQRFSFAQEVPSQSIYAELGGAGLAYSFNYDFRFDKGDINSWGMRVGAGGWSRNDGNYSEGLLTVPVQVNRLLGKSRHFFEFGGGATFIYYRDRNSWGNNDYVYKNFNFILDSGNTPAFMGTLNMGYRKIPEDGGFTFRANITPIFNHTGFWPLFGAVSFGYSF